MHGLICRWLLSGLVLAGLASRATAGVIVVAPTGGQFTNVAAAIAAAAEGDTLLVRPGSAAGSIALVVDGKSLALVADVAGASQLSLFASITVKNLAAGQQVTLTGFALNTAYLVDDFGAVWIERCSFVGQDAIAFGFGFCSSGDNQPGETALTAVHCASVTLLRSQFAGGLGSAGSTSGGGSFVSSTKGGTGVTASSSSVALIECALVGGDGRGGQVVCFEGGGGAGLAATASLVLLSGSSAQGGEAVFIAGTPTGPAGPGVQGDAASAIQVLDSAVSGGTGASAFATAPGTVTTFPGVARSFQLGSPLREGQPGTLALQGVQGDFVGFFWSFGSGSLPMPARNGWFLLSPAFIAGPFFVGTIAAANGAWSIPFAAPLLPPAVQGQTFLLQPWFQYAGGVTLGSGTALTLLDAAL